MRTVIVMSAIVGILSAGGGRTAAQSPKGAGQVPELIEQLGSSSFAERNRAMKALEATGPAALPALRQALKSPASAEVLARVRMLVRNLENQKWAAKLLAPRHVRLALKGVRVADAAAELARQSGYPIHLSGADSRSDLKVTLDTGDVPFWDALQRLCKEAGLVEDASLMGPFDARAGLPESHRSLEIVRAPLGIYLTAGKPVEMPTALVGSLRIQLVKVAPAPGGAVDLVLEVGGEPRFQGLECAAAPRVIRALDEQGQRLAEVSATEEPLPPNKKTGGKLLGHRGGGWVVILLDGTVLKGNSFGPAPPVAEGPFLTRMRLRRGEKKAGSLKELTTKLVLRTTVADETPVVLDKILQAAGRSARAADGSRLTVQHVNQLPNKDLRLQVTWEKPSGSATLGMQGSVGGSMTFKGNRVEIGGFPGDRSPAALAGAPRLLGSDGKEWALAEWSSQGWTITPGQFIHRLTLLYRPGPGPGEPARLTVPQQRTFTFEVSLTFRNIPLP